MQDALGLGIDLGSVAVRVALAAADGQLTGLWSRPVLGHPTEALQALLADIPAPATGLLFRLGVTGNGRDLIHGPVHEENEVVALTRALPLLCPEARMVIEVGGHSARFVYFDPVTHALLDYGLNQQCAAGSGSFFDQQAGRLGLDTAALARLAAEAPRGATVIESGTELLVVSARADLSRTIGFFLQSAKKA